jgi:tetratricopeptide (TPR) repeat protein
MQKQESSPWASTQFKILILLTCWCLTPGTSEAVTLVGKVTVQSVEIKASLVTLKLENVDGSLVDQKVAGLDGRFEFDGLTKSQFRLRVDAPGFQPQEQEIDLTGTRDNVYIEIYLRPLAKVATPSSELSALTDESSPKKARQEYEKGSRALQEVKIDEAVIHFKKAVADYPCYARAQTDLARALVMQNKAPDLEIPEAEKALKKSISCDGGFLEAYTRLSILLNGTKQYTESEKVLEEGLRRAPSSWSLYYQLGATHSALGEFEKAEADYLKVRSFNPAPPTELHVRLADLYHRMKAYDKAYSEMQAYLRDDPNGRYAARTQAVMREMETSGVIHPVQSQPSTPPRRFIK